jgi:hypothetical protein
VSPQVPGHPSQQADKSDWSKPLSDILFDMSNTKTIGDATEAVVMAEFLKAGFPVLIPFGENTRYDLVVDAGGRFLRVQCKTASSGGDGAICSNARSIRLGGPRSALIVAQSYRGQADLFGVLRAVHREGVRPCS